MLLGVYSESTGCSKAGIDIVASHWPSAKSMLLSRLDCRPGVWVFVFHTLYAIVIINPLVETNNVRTIRYQREFLKDGTGRNIIMYKMENSAFRVRAFVRVCARACVSVLMSACMCVVFTNLHIYALHCKCINIIICICNYC